MNASTTTKILKQLNELHQISGQIRANLDRWPDQEDRDLWGDDEYLSSLNKSYTALLQAERYVAAGEALRKSMKESYSGDEELDAAVDAIDTIFFDEFHDARHAAGNHRGAMPAAIVIDGDYLYEAKLTPEGWLAVVEATEVQGTFTLNKFFENSAVFGVHPTPAAAIAAAKSSGWKSPHANA